MAQTTVVPLLVKGNQWRVGSYPYGMIHVSAALYIGLVQSTNLNIHEIAKIFGATPRQIAEFHKAINKDEAAGYALRGRLPASYGQHLFEGFVRCKHCGRKIDYVPCVACCDFGVKEANNADEPLVRCNLPSNAHPGSIEKLAVMATRIEIGMTPTCEDDSLLLPECQTAKAEPLIYATNLQSTLIARGHLYDANSPTRLCKIGNCGNPRHPSRRGQSYVKPREQAAGAS